MKVSFFLLVIAFTLTRAGAQGTLFFDNRPPSGDARVVFIGNASMGAGSFGPSFLTADLLLLTLNGTTKNIPLTPTTTFRTSPVAARFYVQPVDIVVPNSNPGDSATLVMRVWTTSLGPGTRDDYLQGRSLPFTVILGTPSSPAPLNGLELFSFGLIPEPSTFVILAAGIAALLLLQLSKNRSEGEVSAFPRDASSDFYKILSRPPKPPGNRE